MPALRNRIEQLERAFPEERPLSRDDQDALDIYRGCRWLHGDITPSWRDLEGTAVYGRGRELAEQREKPARSTTGSHAASWFAILFGRRPEAGDILRFVQVQVETYIEQRSQKDFIEAWSRQLPDIPCALKLEDGKLLKRTMPPPAGGAPYNPAWPNWPIVWQPYESSVTPEITWHLIEREAGAEVELSKSAPVKFPGVVFTDRVHCRPATESELEEDTTEPSPDSLIAILLDTLRRLKEEGKVQA